jgi:hypothetical protein
MAKVTDARMHVFKFNTIIWVIGFELFEPVKRSNLNDSALNGRSMQKVFIMLTLPELRPSRTSGVAISINGLKSCWTASIFLAPLMPTMKAAMKAERGPQTLQPQVWSRNCESLRIVIIFKELGICVGRYNFLIVG